MPSQVHRTPTRLSLRKILEALYVTDSELTAFCIDHFHAVSRKFTNGMDRIQKENLLLEAIHPQTVLFALEERHGSGSPIIAQLIKYERPPVLKNASPQICALGDQIEVLRQKRFNLEAQGADVSELDLQLRQLRRQQRDLPRQPQLQPGEVLEAGRYKLIEKLGDGGFGVVWCAWDAVMDLTVAIKVMHPNLIHDEARFARFHRGAKQMSQCHHPHIVRVREGLREDEGFHYYVMEHLSGGTLMERVLNKTLSRQEALRIIVDVGDALSYAHKRGLIHRDVKPENILLDCNGEAQLTDFDLVWVAYTTGGTKSALGTALYAAPEAFDEGHPGHGADIFSLAMTCAFVLFEARLPGVALREGSAFIRQLPCAEAVKQVLLRATQPDPSQRYASMADFAAALVQAWEQSMPPVPTTVEMPQPPPASLLKPEAEACLGRYRTAFETRYGSWDIKDVLPPGTSDLAWAKSLALPLVYLKLPCAPYEPNAGSETTFSIQHWSESPRLFDDAELLPTPPHRVLRGFAGSGKSTYIRRLALELLGRGAGLPLMIEARRLARMAQNSGQAGDALIMGYLEGHLRELCASPQDIPLLLSFLQASVAPTPILFIDGWEDLGALSERVQRALFSFVSRFARVRLYVTAQPCARSIPSGREYLERNLLPPTKPDLQNFSKSLAEATAQLAPDVAAGATYWANLMEDEQIFFEVDHEIVASPLFLIQAILTDSQNPFPAQRHKLYPRYLESLRSRSTRKTAEGALTNAEVHPALDSASYLTELAHLAHIAMNGALDRGAQMQVDSSLPPERLFVPLGEDESEGRWNWLNKSLGLAYRLPDGRYQFRSKILAAYMDAFRIHSYGTELDAASVIQRLAISWEGDSTDALAMLILLLSPQQQGEFLFALKSVCANDALSANVRTELSQLFGSFLANGYGEAADIHFFVQEAQKQSRQGHRWPLSIHWRITRELTRRVILGAELNNLIAAGAGREWAEIAYDYERLRLPAALSSPQAGTAGRALVDVLSGPLQLAEHVALGRVISGCGLPWPATDHRLLLLSLWPSTRRLVGQRGQQLVALGFSAAELVANAYHLVRQPRWDGARTALLALARVQNFTKNRDMYQDLQWETTIHWLSNQPRASIRELQARRSNGWNLQVLETLWSKWPTMTFHSASEDTLDAKIGDAGKSYARTFLREQRRATSSSLLEAVIDNCHARVGPRVLLAYLPRGSRLMQIPEVSLLARAGYLSVHPGSDRALYQQELRECEGSVWPIWIDLARYLAGQADADVWARLRAPLTSYPELQEESIMQWGAQYFLKGDIWLPGDSVITVDALCEAAEQQPLPFLDELPEPLAPNAGP